MTGDVYWMWQAHENGKWGLIMATIPWAERMGPVQLLSRVRDLAVVLEPIAAAHGEATGQPIRFARFELLAVEEI